MKAILFEHICCPLHRYTFSVKAIRRWVEQTCEGKVLNLFAGQTKLAVNETRNDLDPDAPAEYHLDALEFLCTWDGATFDTILLDPPYAYRKSMELYKGIVCSPFRQLKDAVPACLNAGGKVITFGYHSVVMGRSRSFRLEQLALFSHGGAIHDTIASVERYQPPGQVKDEIKSSFFPHRTNFLPVREKIKRVWQDAGEQKQRTITKWEDHEQQHLLHQQGH